MNKPDFFTVDRIFSLQKIPDQESVQIIWEEFVRWTYIQFNLNRHVSFGTVGDLGFKLQEDTNKIIPFFFFNENFLKKCNLTVKVRSFLLKPVVKINFQTISNNLSSKRLTCEDIQAFVTTLIEFVKSSLKDEDSQFLVIDLDILGKIVKKQKEVWFQHTLSNRKDILRNTGIRFHVKKEQSKFSNVVTLNKLSLLSTQEGFLPKIERKESQIHQKQKQTTKIVDLNSPYKKEYILPEKTFRANTPSKSQLLLNRKHSETKMNKNQFESLKKEQSQISNKRSLSLKELTKTKFNSLHKPSQPKQKEESSAGWQMMAAGSDPFKKNESYSKLTENVKSLMATKFQFSKNQLKDNIPVIDMYSRTRACPIAAQRQNVLIGGRIGANYCQNSYRLDITSEFIKFTKLQNSILSSDLPSQKVHVVDQFLEYKIMLKKSKTLEQTSFLQNLKRSYQRFIKLFKMIPDSQIASFQERPNQKFLSMIQFATDKNEDLFQKVLFQIQQNYIFAIKKSILEYILQDPLQRIRLSVHFKFNPVKNYGQVQKPQLTWQRSSFSKIKDIIEKRLIKNSRNVLRIVNQWKRTYQNQKILCIPQSFSEYFTVEDFRDRQKIQIQRFRNKIVEQWIPLVSEIYKVEISDLGNNMEKCRLFFDSTSTLLQIKLREKIIKELNCYKQFFQNFNMQALNPPQTAVHLTKTVGFYEKSLIIVRISHRREQIYFMDNLDQIQSKLLQIVTILRQSSLQVIRPQNFITKSHRNYLKHINEEQLDFCSIKASISSIIKRNIENTKKSLQIYNKYSYLLTEQRRVQDWIVDKKHDRREYSLTLSKYRKLYDEVMEEVPFFIRVSMIFVDSSELKRFFLSAVQQIVFRIQQSVHSLVLRKSLEIYSSLDHIIEVASSSLTSCEHLVEIQDKVQNFKRVEIKELQKEYQDLIKWTTITLFNTFYPVSSQDLHTIYETSQLLNTVHTQLDYHRIHLGGERFKMETDVKKQSLNLSNKVKALMKNFQNLKEFTGTVVKDSALQLLGQLRKKTNEYLEDRKVLNLKEQTLGLEQTELEKLNEWDKILGPFQEMWGLFDKFIPLHHSWTRQDIFKLKPQFIQSQCTAMVKKASQLADNSTLKNFAAANVKMCENLSEEIRKFMNHIPLIAIFSNVGLKSRHLQKIVEIIQFKGDMESFRSLNLHKIIAMNTHKYIKQLQAINYEATRQHEVQKMIEEVKSKWNEVEFKFKQYKNTEMNILTESSIQEIQGLLDEHLLKVLSAKGTVYAKTYENELKELEKWLNDTAQLIQLSSKIQSSWTNLEPVMSSQDFLRQSSSEGFKFRLLDEQWKNICSFYYETRNLLQITKNKSIITNLKNCQKNIEVVKKGLNTYLDSKRIKFPRFFLVSDKQLLQIISQRNELVGLQPHLKKLFSGIDRIIIEDNRYITGMISKQNEVVPFYQKINTVSARGNVDQVLKEVEEKMYANVKRQILESYQDYEKLGMKEFLFNKCGMAVTVVVLICWSRLVEKSIAQESLKMCVQKIEEDLQQLVEIAKQSQLSQDKILILESLMTLQIHCLNIAKDLNAKNVNSVNDFEWESQLRYYFCSSNNTQEADIYVRMIFSQFKYNYEYLGNQSRLVITPLTDRCYRTMCTAMRYNLGGLLQGSFGTGKTETVKDLAHALAFYCFQFNCSDTCDPKILGRIFKGVVASGIWCCLDEFNKVSAPVLSVLAQQIFYFQRAKAEKTAMVFLQDTEFKLRRQSQIFITMNSLSFLKTNFPENLISLFRPVMMISPDVSIIAETTLFIYGFKQCRNLSKKIITTYRLCSKLIEAKFHDDFCIREIKTVMKVSKKLKKRFPEMEEQKIIVKALTSLNFPKYISDEIIAFKGILNDIFPDIAIFNNKNQKLEKEIEKQFVQRNLTYSEYRVNKILQIHETMQTRPAVMIVGGPMSGKSISLEILNSALSLTQNSSSIQMCKINPKSITEKQLFGNFDQNSKQWVDGLLSIKLKQLVSQTQDKKAWLIFDGPLDSLWIQNIHSLLDDSKKLCLPNGEIVPINENITIMFETMDLFNVSPATVGRCAIVCFQSQSLSREVLLNFWKHCNNDLGKYAMKIISSLFSQIPDTYAEVQKLHTDGKISLISLTSSFLHIFDHYVQRLKTSLNLSIKTKIEQQQYKQDSLNLLEIQVGLNEKEIYSIAGSSFIYSLMCSFGVLLDSNSRKQFQIYLKRLVISSFSKTKNEKVYLPEKGSLFQYYFYIDSNSSKLNSEWKKWNDQLKAQQFPKNIPMNDIKIKTVSIKADEYLMNLFISRKIPVMLYGASGTGKSTLVSIHCEERARQKDRSFMPIALSTSSTCQSIRDQIENSFQKRGSKYIIGPKNSQSMIMSVDDVNMPQKQKYGAQTSIQFFRQLLDSRGFYDLASKQKYFRELVDTQFVFTMNSNRNQVSQRFLRHCALIRVNQYDDESITSILQPILSFNFSGHPEQRNIKVILRYCLQIYEFCQKSFPPTPSKLHYNFNFRDLHKLVTSICKADKLKVHSQNIGRLWGYEAKRVFKDRLMPKDKLQVQQMINSIGKKWGKNMQVTYFTDILSIPPQKSYEEVTDIQKINLSVTVYLNNYNMNTEKPMNLVLFKYALEHVLIIYRILQQPSGHALLIGNPATGRKSFATLASFIAGLEIFPLEIITKSYRFSQLKEEIKTIFRKVGLKGNKIGWILRQNDLIDTSFVDCINSILKIGNVPNIFSSEQKMQICQRLRKQANQNLQDEATLDQIFSYFQKKIKDSLRIIICLNPTGKSFHSMIRRYPSFVNCMTIDWIDQWPQQGLISVANKVLDKVEIKHKDKYIKAIQYLNESAKKYSQDYYNETKRISQVNSSFYLQFLNIFKNLLSKKRKETRQLIFKYSNGYRKIVEAETKIEEMKFKLEDLKPKLRKAEEQTAPKMIEVQVQKNQANLLSQSISCQEIEASESINKAADIQNELQKSTESRLQHKRQEFQLMNNKISELSYQLQWAIKMKEKLESQYKELEASLQRANTLISSLSAQKMRWQELSQFYKMREQRNDASCLLSSAIICYSGPFTKEYRQKLITEWQVYLQKMHLQVQDKFSLINFLASPLLITQWRLNGLSHGDYNADNAIIISNSKRWPLMIDPQQQASKWLKAQMPEKKLKAIKTHQDNFMRNLQNSIQFGTPVLIQNLGREINPQLYPIILKQTFKKGPTSYLKLGENTLIYSPDFLLYMTTKLQNPSYNPEIFTQVSIINFSMSEESIKQQFFSMIVQKEKPEISDLKLKIRKECFQDEKELLEIDSKIIQLINTSQNLLSDQAKINIISSLKQKTLKIKENQEISKKAQNKIQQQTKFYQALSEQASCLFSQVSNLSKVNCMYHYSLHYFNDILLSVLKRNQKHQDLQDLSSRLQGLIHNFRLKVFKTISKSLFQKDRLTFAVLISFRILNVTNVAIQFLILPSESQHPRNKPQIQWLTDKLWMDLTQLQTFSKFQHITENVKDKSKNEFFEKIIKSKEPFQENLPEEYQNFPFEDKILLYKCLRPQKMKEILTLMVLKVLDTQYILPIQFKLNQVLKDSDYKTPIMLVLAPGLNPLQTIMSLSRQKNISLEVLSLGKGQEQITQKLIRKNIIRGGWVILQNCHLMMSWLQNLIKILQWLSDDQRQVNSNFRIWMTTSPTDDFPLQILQRSLKIAIEDSKDPINNLSLSKEINQVSLDCTEQIVNQNCFNELKHKICLFHRVIQQRKQYGVAGWSVPYDFSQEDLKMSLSQVSKLFVRQSNDLKKNTSQDLKQIICEVIYGNRINIPNDKKILRLLFDSIVNNNLVEDQIFTIGNSFKSILPHDINKNQRLQSYTQSFSAKNLAQFVGLSENATFTKDCNQSFEIVKSLGSYFSMIPRVEQSPQKLQQQLRAKFIGILNSQIFPSEFDLKLVRNKFPLLSSQPINTFLNQEVQKYNCLIRTIRNSLETVISSLNGEIIVNDDIWNLMQCLASDKIPSLWISKSYPTSRFLGSYLRNFFERIEFLKSWIAQGTPRSYWLGGFFCPKSFFTAYLLNYSRKNQIPFDQVTLELVLNQNQFSNEFDSGIKIHGLYLRGASWDTDRQMLVESKYGQPYEDFPIILLTKATKIDCIKQAPGFEVPLYRASIQCYDQDQKIREHNSIGSQANYIISIRLPTEQPCSHWLKRGVAFFTQSDNQ